MSRAALYARVSTKNQELEDQIRKLKEWAENEEHEYEVFKETASGSEGSEREEFENLMESLDQFDFVAITKLDRFGRSLRDMLANIEDVNEKCGGIVVIDDQFGIDTRGEETLQQRIMRDFLSLFADVERRMIRRRMKEGYDRALEDGRVGRPEALSEGDKDKLVGMYESGRFTWKGLQEEFDVSRSTLSKALKERGVLE